MSYLDSNSGLKWNAKLTVETLGEHQAFCDTNDSGIKEDLIGPSGYPRRDSEGDRNLRLIGRPNSRRITIPFCL